MALIDISSFTHNNLPDSNLSIFEVNDLEYYYNNATVFVNEEFLKRIKIPYNFDIKIKNRTIIY